MTLTSCPQGLWKLPVLWTRTRTRAHRTLDGSSKPLRRLAAHTYHNPLRRFLLLEDHATR